MRPLGKPEVSLQLYCKTGPPKNLEIPLREKGSEDARLAHQADHVVLAHVTSVSPGRDVDSRALCFRSSSLRRWFASVDRGDLRHQLFHERLALSVESRKRKIDVEVDHRGDPRAVIDGRWLLTIGHCNRYLTRLDVVHTDELVEPALLGGLCSFEDEALVGDEELADVDGRRRRHSGHAVTSHATNAVADAASTNGSDRDRNALRTTDEVGTDFAFLDEAGVLHSPDQRLVLLEDEFRVVGPDSQGGREFHEVLGLIVLGPPVVPSLKGRAFLLLLSRCRCLCCLAGTKLLEHVFSSRFRVTTLGLPPTSADSG